MPWCGAQGSWLAGCRGRAIARRDGRVVGDASEWMRPVAASRWCGSIAWAISPGSPPNTAACAGAGQSSVQGGQPAHVRGGQACHSVTVPCRGLGGRLRQPAAEREQLAVRGGQLRFELGHLGVRLAQPGCQGGDDAPRSSCSRCGIAAAGEGSRCWRARRCSIRGRSSGWR